MKDYFIGMLPGITIGFVCGMFVNPWWLGMICSTIIILAVEYRATYFEERSWRW